MSKRITIILINLLFLIVIFILLDIFTYKKEYLKYEQCARYSSYIKYLSRQRSDKYNYNVLIKGQEFNGEKQRPFENFNSHKKPIAIFGCSFAYGAHLNDDETVSHKLAIETRRPVFNFSRGGWGPQHMLYQLKTNEIYDMLPEPEFLIYIYIDDHVNRIQTLVDPIIGNGEPCILYKQSKEKLVQDRLSMHLLRSPLCGAIKLVIYRYFTSDKSKRLLLEEHFIEAKKEMNKHWPNTKFIILLFTEEPLLNNPESKLPENNIQIIRVKDFTNINLSEKKYLLPDEHPNEKAWEIVSKGLIKKMNL